MDTPANVIRSLETVWKKFGDVSIQDRSLAIEVALCRERGESID